MGEHARDDVLRHGMRAERLLEDAEAPVELRADDPVMRVRFTKRAPSVGRACPEERRRMFVLEARHARRIRALEEVPDHHVRVAAGHEVRDQRPERSFPADSLEVTQYDLLGAARPISSMMPPAVMSIVLPDPEKTRRNTGLALYMLGQLVGGGLLAWLFIVMPAVSGDFGLFGLMCIGAVLAFPACTLYLTIPRLLDRYDPEPWYALVGCLLWGGIAACGFSATINTFVGEAARESLGAQGADALSSVISAPFVEEFWKAVGVAGVFYFLRREFDGVVDGIIYATFVALGFATVENVIYYAEAAGNDALPFTFILRGVVAPWGHPVYTSMTGIGFGIARETERPWLRWSAPLFGYTGAVVLHMLWNGSAVVADRLGEDGGTYFLCMLPVWLIFVGAFVALVIGLVMRRGRIIRRFLEDEVALRNLGPQEVDLICSAFGLLTARIRYGTKGAEFVRAAARLALSKWHSTRAANQNMRTVSMDFIVPLRHRMSRLRQEIGRQVV